MKKTKKVIKSKKKVMKRAVVKKVKKIKAKKSVKKVTAKKKSAAQKAVKAVKAKLLGKVTHYYDRIGVAIIDLESPIKLGDIVVLKRGSAMQVQPVTSMQIEHAPVAMAKKGDVIGLKVSAPVEKGTMVMPA